MEDMRLGHIFRLISNAAKKDMDNLMKDQGLTMSQCMILEHLSNSPRDDLSQKAIERHFNLSHPTISGILKRLERNGFIKSEVSAADRRSKDISITDKARNIDDIAKKRMAEMEETILRGMSGGEAATLHALLMRVLYNITGEQNA